MKNILLSILIISFIVSCKKDKEETPTPAAEPQLIFKFKFDSTQVRLNNLGQTAEIPDSNAGQSPVFNVISAHYLELAPTAFTQLGQGSILYTGPSTELGGEKAIDFNLEKKIIENEVYLSIPLKDIPAGEYQYIRVSLAYQNYDVKLKANNINLTGRLASFVGYNSYITTYTIKDSSRTLNENKKQGYWGFESVYSVSTGQAPATTVPNPIAATSPIPAGSCVVTGQFTAPFIISSSETTDITVVLSLSINKSFEWRDKNPNGIWEPLLGENVVDMGLRGLIPLVIK